MTDDTTRPAAKEPARADLLKAIEGHLRSVCGLVADSPEWRNMKLSREYLVFLARDVEVIRLMAATGRTYFEVIDEAYARFPDDDPRAAQRSAEECRTASRLTS